MLQSCLQTSNRDVRMMVHLSERTFVGHGHPLHPWLFLRQMRLLQQNMAGRWLALPLTMLLTFIFDTLVLGISVWIEAGRTVSCR